VKVSSSKKEPWIRLHMFTDCLERTLTN